MSLFFLLNNLHFALEILGALAFLTVGWLALDAFLIRRDFTTGSRAIGFIFLTAWQVLHAFNFTSEVFAYAGYAVFFLGIIFVAGNLILERPRKRPEFKAIVVLPGLGTLLAPFNIVVTLGLFLITFLAFHQYKMELKKALLPFWLGFLFLSLGALSSIFYTPDSLSALWIVGHLFQLIGFFAIGWWVWSYLQLRIREELLLIFVSTTLFMAVIVSLSFSSILMDRMEDQTKASILTETRVLDLAILRLQEEASTKARLLAARPDIGQALGDNDFVKLEEILGNLIEEEKLGFLTILDKEGYVILRAHALTKKDDNLSEERAVAAALFEGESFVTIESSPAEKLSIRAASPVIIEEEVSGAIVAGFPLDNPFVDSIKRITGLQMSVFEGNTRVATTILNPDGRTRSIDIKQVDSRVSQTVLKEGGNITLRTEILSRPFLASYLPLKNSDGEIVGMISAARSQREILEIAQATNRLTLVVVMIIMLTLITPIYLLTRRLSREIG